MLKLIGRYEMSAPFAEFVRNPPLRIRSAKKANHLRSSSQPSIAHSQLKLTRRTQDAKHRELQMQNYINSKRPKTASKLRSSPTTPNLLVEGGNFAKSARIHSRHSSCVDLNMYLSSALSARKLVIEIAPQRNQFMGCSGSSSRRSSIVVPTPLQSNKEPLQSHNLKHLDQALQQKYPKSYGFTAKVQRLQRPKPFKRTIYSKQVEANLDPTDEVEGLSDELNQYRQRCMSANSASLTEKSDSLINSQALTPWD